MTRVWVKIAWGEDDHGRFVATAFEDGAEIIARPIEEPWAETAVHDPLHSILAAIGGRPSPTLWRVAHGLDLDHDEVRLEEAAVAQVQAILREAQRSV